MHAQDTKKLSPENRRVILALFITQAFGQPVGSRTLSIQLQKVREKGKKKIKYHSFFACLKIARVEQAPARFELHISMAK